MMRQATLAATLAPTLAFAAALPAAAQQPKVFQPSRDVMVEYHIDNARPGDHRSDTVRMYFTDGGMKMRIEPVGQPGYSIVDRRNHSMIVVMAQQHMYMQMAYDPSRVMAFDATDVTFSRVGTDTVAGITCTVYDAQRQGRSGQVCLTGDGLMLRAKSAMPGQPEGGMEATKVTYAPQSADLFSPPPGFQKMDMAAMGHGMPPPGSR